ncbi:fatty acyl-CoA reductase 1-like [Lytechinus variegatus]|uniref:fatty acyl-CoA reductase 1-like n=1 Tax=Lytechinus variegatus TaxID=7654 RepID=UPI001BB1ED5A|nr:fatty acyl-CoA reductase 1-like [Lytechinus variegatus]
MAYRSVSDFYAGKTLMITGATGFIGKVLLEKLLRCCPDIKKIFLLVRPKRDKGATARIKEITSGIIFDKVREAQPNFRAKLVPIESDLSEPDLALNEEDIRTLQEETELVFHVAATVRFDEKLSISLRMNVSATRKILQLSKGMDKLLVFHHVSTAYSNCDQSRIEEVVYPPPVDPYKILDAAEWMSDDMIESLTPMLLGKRPNTYTFTKALAEYVVMEEGKGLPICISRPSTVLAAWKEPFPGWVDNILGGSGLVVAVGKGLLTTVLCDPKAILDVTPVDVIVNAMIGVTWYTGIHKPASIPVYNLVNSHDIPYKLGTHWADLVDCLEIFPMEKALGRPMVQLTKYSLVFEWMNLFNGKIPAFFMDCVSKLRGQKPMMMKINQRVVRLVYALRYFMLNSWDFSHQNIEALSTAMNEKDREVFFTDMKTLYWPSYMKAYVLGAKRFILNEDLDNLPAAHGHQRMLRNLRWTFNTVLAVVIWRILMTRSKVARNFRAFVINVFFIFIRRCRMLINSMGRSN